MFRTLDFALYLQNLTSKSKGVKNLFVKLPTHRNQMSFHLCQLSLKYEDTWYVFRNMLCTIHFIWNQIRNGMGRITSIRNDPFKKQEVIFQKQVKRGHFSQNRIYMNQIWLDSSISPVIKPERFRSGLLG